MYFKHSLLTTALSQKSIYSALILTTEDVLFLIHADNSALNAVERFEDGDHNCDVNFVGNVDGDDNCDDNFVGNVSIDNGVDTRACGVASGVTTCGTTGNSTTAMPRGKRPLRDVTSSSDLPLTSLRLAAVVGMIFWLEVMLFWSSFVCDV